MNASGAASDGGIFISYRREDAASYAGRLHDRLTDRFGDGRVFMDVDSIRPGVDFDHEIRRAIGSCVALLVVIGPRWLQVVDRAGRPRIDDPNDFVRLEIEAALARDALVVPVLVNGAVMPGPQDLPSSLFRLTRRTGLRIDHESFRRDFDYLFEVLRGPTQEARGAEVPAAGPRSARVVKQTAQDLSVEIQLTHTRHLLEYDARNGSFRLDGVNVKSRSTPRGDHVTIPDGPFDVTAYVEVTTIRAAMLAGFRHRVPPGRLSLDGEPMCSWS